jgi:hypothetical protein
MHRLNLDFHALPLEAKARMRDILAAGGLTKCPCLLDERAC